MRCQRSLVALLLAVLSFASCRDATKSSVADLRTDPEDALVFDPTAVGTTRTAQIRIDNASRFDLRVEFTAEAPFAVDSEIELPAGASVPLEVRFSPQAEGDIVGTLRVRADGFERDLVLRGAAVMAQCPPPAACQRAIANIDGTCKTDALPDGTPCADACVTGVCMGGACTGTFADCDDHDACTIDACAPSSGCISTPATCESPDPCHVPTCDPASGCGLAPVVDGTPCGAAETCAAHVCMSGVCTLATRPDGSACETNSPCQPNGACVQGRCDPGPVQGLAVRWLVSHDYDLGPLIDDSGDMVVRTRGHGVGPSAFGLSPAGSSTWAHNGVAVVHGDAAYFVASPAGPPGIEAVDAATGTQRWFIPDSDLVAPGSPTGAGFEIRKGWSVGLNSSGELVLEVALAQTVALSQPNCVSAWRVTIDPATASTTRVAITPCRWPSFLASDGAGLEYASGEGGISASDASGPLWTLSDADGLLGAAAGYAFVASKRTCHQARRLRILDGRTGTELVDTNMYPRSVVSDGTRVFVLGWTLKPHDPAADCMKYDVEAFDKAAVAIIDPRTGAIVTVPIRASGYYELSNLVLTDRGSVLFAQSGDLRENLPGAITEIDSNGNVTSQCARLARVHGIVLDDERLFVDEQWLDSWSLLAIDLLGVRPAQHGWINASGNNGGTMTALP